MPYLTLPPEQQQKLKSLVANLQAQDNMISLLGEFALAGSDSEWNGVPRQFVRVTPDGRVEYKRPELKLVEDTRAEPERDKNDIEGT